MKKLVALFLTAALLFCGCGKKESPPVSSLDLWVTSQDRGEIYEALAQAWNEAHPEEPIQLNISVYASRSIAGKFSRGFSVSASYNGSSIPDLVELDYATFPEFVFQQTADIYPLQNMLEKHSGAVPGASLYSKNGICFALPYQNQQLVLCYRLDLESQLQSKGNSFENLLELGKDYAQARGEPLLWVDYLGSEVFLSLYLQALESSQDPEKAYELAVSCLEEGQSSGAWGYLPSGDAYSDTFPQLLAQQQITCFVTTRENLLRLAGQEDSIPEHYGVMALPSFAGVSCRVEVPTVAVAVHMSGGDPVLSRDFLGFCRFSEDAKAYPEFYLGAETQAQPELSETYRVLGSLEQQPGSVSLTALDLEPYLTAYSRQVLGSGLPE